MELILPSEMMNPCGGGGGGGESHAMHVEFQGQSMGIGSFQIWTQVIRLDVKALYLLSHLPILGTLILKE